ncbi:MAG: ribonuclease HII [Bacillota bacterium]
MDLNKYTIKELKKYLINNSVDFDFIKKMKHDTRKGVRRLADRYQKKMLQKEKIEQRWKNMNRKLYNLQNKGFELIAGVDEAGRGPLAGPVVASAVILDPEIKILGLNDSKKISYKKREKLFAIIKKKAVAVGTGIVSSTKIDKVNIHNATYIAMREAIKDLNIIPDYILVDGNKEIPDFNIQQEQIIDGDNKVNNIAAASIIAKVTRDRIIEKYDAKYPGYGFKENKGYGTSQHIEALKRLGPTPIHRYSFSIVEKSKDNLVN